MQICIVLLVFAFKTQSSSGACYKEEYYENIQAIGARQPSWRIECRDIKADGRPVEVIIGEENVRANRSGPAPKPLTHEEYLEWTPRAQEFELYADGNVTFTEKTLKNFTKLQLLKVQTFYTVPGSISISPNGLRNLADLRKLTIDGYALSTETVQTLDSMKDRINSLKIFVSKVPGLLNVVSRFTNLTNLLFSGDQDRTICPGASSFPRSIFQKSAATLTEIRVSTCATGKVTREIFRGLRNLRSLTWDRNNVTEIESGAFDDLVNIAVIDFDENQITTLPDGLFENNKKLGWVSFRDQRIDNLSRSNFTHLENPAGLRLLL